ncbi:MAG: terminase small subunit [Eubacteriales bacterium]
MTDKLTVKQEKYAQGLFAGLSQREAYKQAYDAEKMTDKSVDEKACELAANVKVASRIEQLTNELKERNMVTVEKVLAELSHIALDDISNYLSFRTEKVFVGHDADGNPVSDYRTIVDIKDSDTIDTRGISEVSVGKDGQFRFKLYGKDNALVNAGKHLGMFVEKKEISGPNGGPIETKRVHDLSKLTDEELDLYLKLAQKAENNQEEDS